MSKDQGNILKLDGVNNYEQWKIEASAALKERRLWKYVKDNTYYLGTFGNITIQDTKDKKGDDEDTAQDLTGGTSSTRLVISKDAQDIQDDLDAAMGFLIRSCKPSQQILIKDCNTPYEAWNKLATIYGKPKVFEGYHLLAQYLALKRSDFKDAQSYINKIQEMHDKILTCKVSIEDLQVHVLLHGLNSEKYQPLRVNLDTHSEKLSYMEAENAFLLFEERMSISKKEDSVLSVTQKGKQVAKGKPKKPPYKSYSRGTDGLINQTNFSGCRRCGFHNHKMEDCCTNVEGLPPAPKKIVTKGTPNSGSTSKVTVAIAQNTPEDTLVKHGYLLSLKEHIALSQPTALITLPNDPDIIYLDSGCTQHCTPHVDLLWNYKRAGPGHFLELGNGDNIIVEGKGTLKLKWTDPKSATSRIIEIYNVLYSSKLRYNLISQSGLAVQGWRTTYYEGKEGNPLEAMASKKNGNKKKLTWFKALTSGYQGLYQMQVVPVPNKVVSLITKSVKSSSTQVEQLLLWHNRLGHLNFQAVSKAIGIPLPKDLPICEDCIIGKQHRRSFPPSVTPKSSTPLQLVHTDVCGPQRVASHSGCVYFVVFVDDYSRYTVTLPLQHKSEVFEAFKRYQTWAEKQTGHSLRILRSDNGGEYTSNAMGQYLTEKGIAHQTTVPATSQQNGVSERTIRTLMEKVRSMLHAAAMSHPWWIEALMTATYTKNASPARKLNWKSPCELFLGKQINLNLLKKFGCIAYTYVPKAKRSKLDNCGEKCIFLGYPENQKAWRLWNLDKKKIIISTDVIFLENAVHHADTPDEISVSELDEYYVPLEDIPEFLPVTHKDKQVENGNTLGETQPVNQEDIQKDVPQPSEEVFQWADNILEEEADEPLPHVIADEADEADSPIPLIRASQSQFEGVEIPLIQPSSNVQPINPPLRRGTCTIKVPTDKLPQQNYQYQLYREAQQEVEHQETDLPHDINPVLFYDQVLLAQADLPQDLNPVLFYDQVLLAHTIISVNGHVEPKSYNEAISGMDVEVWKTSMKAEYDSLLKNETWDLVPLPMGRKALEGKWVYRIKTLANGDIDKFKSRWVVKGFLQKYGIDYTDTYATVAKFTSIRLLCALAASRNWEIHQVDIETAFLQGSATKGIFIYVKQPKGFEVPGKEDWVCQLKKGLYGLKQGPRLWQDTFDKAILDMGFIKSKYDPSVYLSTNGILANYVDDILVFAPTMSDVTEIKAKLASHFAIKDLGEVKYYLGLEITRDRKKKSLCLSQHKYIEDVLQQFNVHTDVKSVDTPLPTNLHGTPDNTSETTNPFAQLVGCMMYVMLGTRPDLAFTIGYLSQYLAHPTEHCWNMARRALHYLAFTKHFKLTYHDDDNIISGYADSDWASQADSKSVSGYVFMMNGAAISWKSKKQTIIALSTAEAEYVSACTAAKEAVWLRNFAVELIGSHTAITLYEDNQSCIALAKDPKDHDRTKHIKLRYHYLRQVVNDNEVKLEWIPTSEMVADALTKPLAGSPYKYLVAKMGID